MMIFLDQPYTGALFQILELEKPKNILQITGGASYEDSQIKNYFDNLSEFVSITRYSGLGNNPQYARLAHVIKDIKNTDFDIVIAVGGGSVIDYAKLITLYLPNPGMFVSDFTKVQEVKSMSPIVAIPTTAGTGSEVTHFAVMYKDGKKYSVGTNEILPRHVIVDPVLTYSMDPYLTATTGMDALCQAIESLWARSATPESKEYAKKALGFLVPHIERAVLSPDSSTRKAMALGAYYSGKAINISKTTGPHAFSYFLTHQFGVPHGEAVAMTMEIFIEMNFPYLDEEVKMIYYNIFNVESKEEFIDRINQIKRNIGLRPSVSDAGVRDDVILQEFIKSVNIERLNNNPGPMDEYHLRKLFQRNIVDHKS